MARFWLCQRAVLYALCSLLASEAEPATVLYGAGSSLAAQLYSAASLAYSFVQPNVSVRFADLGSDRGLCRLKSASKECAPNDAALPLTIDFAGSDVILTEEDYSEYPDLQMYPTVATAVVPIFNLGSTTDLVLSTSVLAQIFVGSIRYWDDPAILKLNPSYVSWQLPLRQRIELVVCYDRCGSTDIFKRALASFDSSFKRFMESSTSLNWANVTPTTQVGDQGIISYILTTPFTLGYAALGTASMNSVPMARLMKANGSVVTASTASMEYAMLQKGSDFGNNGDDLIHLTADIYNAAGLWSWPITSYTYLVMRKWTLRPGATCEHVKQTMAFWYWFWTSEIVAGMVQEYNFSNLPQVVRQLVANRFMQDIRCNLRQVWQPEEPKFVTAVGPAAVNVLFLAMTKIYSLIVPQPHIKFVPNDASVGELDPGEQLKVDHIVVTTGRSQHLIGDGVSLLFAGLAIVAITQLTVVLDGKTLAMILDGAINTWLAPEIVALNPKGILDANGKVLTDHNQRIVLLQGPTATSIPLQRMMKVYWPQYSGTAILSAVPYPNEDILRSMILGNPFAFSVTPFVDIFPAGVKPIHLRREDGKLVAPSSDAIQACASQEVFSAGVTTTSELQFSKDTSCYPLSETMFISVKKSQCNSATDLLRTTAVEFIEWLFVEHALDDVIRAASMAPLHGSNDLVTTHNLAALDQITCKPKPISVLPVVLGTSVGVGGLFIVIMSGMLGFRQRNHRDTSAAPKDATQPLCVIFTDIQSSTQLWANIPGDMAKAMNSHHAIIRRLIKQHRLYEVKNLGDSFMCASSEPLNAIAFALDLQRQFFDFDWGTQVIDEVYMQKEKTDTKGSRTPAPRWVFSDLFSGLRVRVGIHYGFGQIKVDPVTKAYDYYGTVVNVAARIESLCHGGQVAVSKEFFDQLGGVVPGGVSLDLGTHNLRGLPEPIHLYQILPSGPLARRKFPPLRLQRVSDHSDEANDVEGAENRSHPTGSSSRSSQAVPVFQAEHHPLVLNCNVSADELHKTYYTVMMTLNTLLATQTMKFKETVLKGLCGRLHVKHPGSSGTPLQTTLHHLVLRILPAIVFHRERDQLGTEDASTPVIPMEAVQSPPVSPMLPPGTLPLVNVFGTLPDAVP